MSSSQQRPILVATDLSARSDRALDRALQLAQSRQCNLVVLYVIESSWKDKFTTPRWSRPIADVRELAQTRLQQILGAAATQSGVNIELMVKEGNTVQAIQEVAQSINAGLIITGVAREESLGRVLVGNTAEKLVRECDTPVLVVKQRPHRAYQQVVAATDFSTGAVCAATSLAHLFPEANLTVYHAFDFPRGTEDEPQVQQAREAAKLKAQEFVTVCTQDTCLTDVNVEVHHGNVDQLLPVYCADNNVDLLVVGTHGLTGLLRTAIGSVAEQLLEHADCDVLIVRQTKEG